MVQVSFCPPLRASGTCINDNLFLRRMAEGEWTNHDIQDPLSSMFTFLAEKRDPERALQVRSSLSELMTAYQNTCTYQQLLTSRDTTKRRDKPEDDLLTLRQ